VKVSLLLLVSVAYMGLLFAVALRGDRAASVHPQSSGPWVYSLSLAVLVTSWTFYGAAGHLVATGWDYITIYLGQVLVMLFGFGMVERTVRIGRRNNVTSLADFLGARYGKSRTLATLVTVITIVGLVPYMALQLKALATSFGAMIPSHSQEWQPDTALILTALLAAFAILFGARSVSSTENHTGMVQAIAFASVIKLVALLAVGLYAAYGYFNGLSDAFVVASSQMGKLPYDSSWRASFIAQTVLGMCALLCLPRQFHVTVIENGSLRDLRTARWVLPGYLVLTCVLALPIAAAGLRALPGSAPDLFVLALPLAAGRNILALLVYLGGLSAASSMVIVESIALSTMLSNEIVLPLFLRRPDVVRGEGIGSLIKLTRRLGIVALLLLAYLFYRAFTRPDSLASLGFLSFAAASQLAPLLLGGLYWRGASQAGALAGLAAGFITWLYTLLLPTMLGPHAVSLVVDGPFGIGWLRPTGLFGVSGIDVLTHGTVWSLIANVGAFVLVSRWMKPGLREQLQAERFLEPTDEFLRDNKLTTGHTATVRDLVILLERVFGIQRTRALLDEFYEGRGLPPLPGEKVSRDLARHVERQLSGALGAASARSVLAFTLQGRDMQPQDVIRLLDDTSHAILFNRELLRASLEHLPQGVSVVDSELRLVAWNQRYVEMFDYPDSLIVTGRPIEEVFRFNAQRGLLGEEPIETQVQRRLERLREGRSYTRERALPDGSVLEIRGNPMPGGGFVTSYADVTAYKRMEEELRALAGTLERRVAQRTTALQEAKAQAEYANRSKSQFVTAAVHDLQQPLTAARMFLSTLQSRLESGPQRSLIADIERALSAQEQVLNSLLDIARLESGTLEVRTRTLRLGTLFEQLTREFQMLAAAKGLELRCLRTRATVRTDPVLLRRVLQNFLSNALRYTQKGGVLVGARRAGNKLRIEIWDTGCGIPQSRHREIFEEFTRLQPARDSRDRALGLGLAIAERIARLLRSEVRLRSWLGYGSVFSIDVPACEPVSLAEVPEPSSRDDTELEGRRIWCIDDDPAVLSGARALLERWGCDVRTALNYSEAALLAAQHPAPEILLLDHHLGAMTGAALLSSLLNREWPASPCVVLMSDEAGPDRERVAREAGWSFLRKPVRAAALRALISQLLVRGTCL
jgi:PAS domain S-box-containing protein